MNAKREILDGKMIVISVSLVFLFVFSVHTVEAQNFQGSFESRFNRYQKGDDFAGDPVDAWNPIAWRGERIHKQIILWSNSQANDLSYTIGDLAGASGAISSSAVRLRFGQNVKGDADAMTCEGYAGGHSNGIEVADALLETEVNAIDPSDPLKVWVTIDVPRNIQPDTYNGTIQISDSQGSMTFHIGLEVVDYTLPEVTDWNFHLDIWQFPLNALHYHNDWNPDNQLTAWSQEHLDLIEPAYTLLADMGQKAVTTYIKSGSLGAESMVIWTKKTNGTWVYDYTIFDNYVEFMFSLGINKQISCFSPVGWNEDKIPYYDEATASNLELSAPLTSATFASRWDHFLTDFKSHLEAKGWFDKTVLYLDEVSEEKLNGVATVVHGNDENWKLGIAYSHGLSSASKSLFYDLSGILEDASNDGISDEKISTFYTSCTQTIPNSYVTPENSPAEMTWMAWHALSEGYDGYLRWAYDYWRSTDPFDMRDGTHTAGDFAMLYRNTNVASITYSSSIRMEMLREGIQDFEKVQFLRSQLASSDHPFDVQALQGLNEIINKFGKTSGSAAGHLIIEAQELIAAIVLGEFSYCRATGGQNTEYYVKTVSTSGGESNLNYEMAQHPAYGYDYHTATILNAHAGESFTFNLENSASSNCARTKIWVDWNGNEEFEDSETVFSAGAPASCENDINHAISLTVPAEQPVGIVRLRVRVAEANEPEPTSCGDSDKSGTVDFELKVLDQYCQPSGGANEEYYVAELETFDGKDNNNIQYAASGFPQNGYNYFREDQATLERGGTFRVLLRNSQGAGCARTVIWIDWNADKDFDDEGEQVFDGNNMAQSCDNPLIKSTFIKVPASADDGLVRMRVQLRDAWQPDPEACVEANFTGTTDFDLRISGGTVLNVKHDPEPLVIYPNPSKEGLIHMKGLDNFRDQVKISLFNLKGELMYSKDFESLHASDSISLYFPQRGIYLIKIDDGMKQATQRIALIPEPN